MHPDQLLARLAAIGHALAQRPASIALIGLGSVGLETDRLDAWSDLDFFVIVDPGHKPHYLADLGWLSAPSPLAYQFANTADGYKALYADGIFCEFAVFEPAELATIPFAPGRIVWQRADAPAGLALPAQPTAARTPPTPEWLLGEALTNLYVGLGRERRGERLSATRFIQGYAVDRVLDLAEAAAAGRGVARDPFAVERRFEQRHPALADLLPTFVAGYAHNRAAALAILTYLEQQYAVNAAIAAAIRTLCA